MKNFHFKSVVLVAALSLVLAGCGATTTQNTTNATNSPTTSAQDSQADSQLPADSGSVVYNMAEVAKHNNQNDCWQVVSGKVYDVTAYILIHKDGIEKMVPFCGKDATSIFDLKHTGKPEAQTTLENYYLSDLE